MLYYIVLVDSREPNYRVLLTW